MGEEREDEEPDAEQQDPESSATTQEADTDPPAEGKEHDL